MKSLGKTVVAVAFGTFALGQFISLPDSTKNIGAFGTSTAGIVELLFFFFAVMFVFLAISSHIKK